MFIHLFDHKTTETPFTVNYVQMAIRNIYYMCVDCTKRGINWKIRTVPLNCIMLTLEKKKLNHYNIIYYVY